MKSATREKDKETPSSPSPGVSPTTSSDTASVGTVATAGSTAGSTAQSAGLPPKRASVANRSRSFVGSVSSSNTTLNASTPSSPAVPSSPSPLASASLSSKLFPRTASPTKASTRPVSMSLSSMSRDMSLSSSRDVRDSVRDKNEREISLSAPAAATGLEREKDKEKEREREKPAPAATAIRVAVRCRPLNEEEKRTNQASAVTCDPENNTVKVMYGSSSKKNVKTLEFDRVFGMYSRQSEVYDSVVKPIVEEALAGFNCTIFAYGPTGTGKTHTMSGDLSDEELWGMVPRAAKTIFDPNVQDRTVKISYLEIYNEDLFDLLTPQSERRLKLMEDPRRGVICHNLEEVSVKNLDDLLETLRKGLSNRATAATLSNHASSRSHAIFTIRIFSKEVAETGEDVVKTGTLNLVDLAGSECIGRSGAKDDRAREAGNINQSLLTLGRVITGLADVCTHIPYRDSKLTRLLQESLGGKAKTAIIATLSPAQNAVEETMSTVDYAFRARAIKNQPQVQQQVSSRLVLREYAEQLEYLKMQLNNNRERQGVYLDPAEFHAMETKIAAQENMISECEATIRQRDGELKALQEDRREWQSRLDNVTNQLTAAETENAAITLQNDTLTRSLTETKNSLADALQREESLSHSLAHALARIEHLETELRFTQDTLQATREKLEKTENDLGAARAEIKKLNGELAEKTQKIHDLTDALQKLTEKQRETEERLQATYVDLQAHKNECAERALTEQRLTEAATAVQELLMIREAEVRTLMQRNSALKAQERERLRVVRAYSASLAEREETLRAQTSLSLAHTQALTDALSTHTHTETQRDAELARSLSALIHTHLSTRREDANTHAQALAQCVDALCAALTSEQRDRVERASSVMRDAQRFTESVRVALSECTQSVNRQENMMKDLAQYLTTQHTDLLAHSLNARTHRESLCSELGRSVDALCVSARTQTEDFHKSTQQRMTDARAHIETRVASIEQTVSEMLQALLQETRSVFSTVTSETLTHNASTHTLLHNASTQLHALRQSLTVSDEKHAETEKAWSAATLSRVAQAQRDVSAEATTEKNTITTLSRACAVRDEECERERTQSVERLTHALTQHTHTLAQIKTHREKENEQILALNKLTQDELDRDLNAFIAAREQANAKMTANSTSHMQEEVQVTQQSRETLNTVGQERSDLLTTVEETQIRERGDTPVEPPHTVEKEWARTREASLIRAETVQRYTVQETDWKQRIFELTERVIA